MNQKYTKPFYDGNGFNCQHCGGFSHQNWSGYLCGCFDEGENIMLERLRACRCERCHNFHLWHNKDLIFPLSSPAPLPWEDMPDDVKADFSEARGIVCQSPRGAAALIRLALQKLMKHLGEKGKNLNDDIAALVKKGLPDTIRQALDAVRVIGNNAVHPGQIDIKDDEGTAIALFELLNIIVQNRISEPKHIKTIYGLLPACDREAIEKRDKKP